MLTSDEMDNVFRALAHDGRRRILDVVKERPGCIVNDILEFFDVSRIQVLKHLRVLEEASLIVSEKHGRERQLFFNPVPIQMIHERWTTDFSAHWAGKLTQLKYRMESQKE